MNTNYSTYAPLGVKHSVEVSPPRSYSTLFTKSSESIRDPNTNPKNAPSLTRCSYGSGSSSTCSLFDNYCTASPCCCCPCCTQCYTPPERPVYHLKDICKGKEGTFSETFKSPFALKTVNIPGWMAYCGMVLCFHSYYQEPIPESPLENYRIHQCHIRFYLEDNTIEVVEPPTFDPGFTQGRVINRGRIALPPPADDAFFTLDHLNVGCEVTFYGKTFYICGCDQFTRRFMNRLGYQVPADTEVPIDQYTWKRKDLITSQFARKAGFDPQIQKAGKFLTLNRKVLRFWAYWDDRCSEYGQLRKFVLQYFLEDDTLAIKEVIEPNSGFIDNPAFLCRSKVPKNINKPYPLPGVKEEALRILNVLGTDGECGAVTSYSYITDRLCPGIEEEECITDRDLAIGATLNIYNRCFILTDCDEFTKRYYRDKYGVEDFTPLVLDEGNNEPPPIVPPPHNGFGTEEDTLANWNKVEISPPRKDELKFLIYDKDILTFQGRLYNAQHKVNSERRFTIMYFVVDRSIQIFEKGHLNSGFKKGLFLARSRLKKPSTQQELEAGVVPKYYLPEDFFIGRVIELNGYNFQLYGADEVTLCYMELHKEMFPQADICKVLNKVREAFGPLQSSDILQMFSCKDTCGLGIQDFHDFRSMILELTKCSLSDHEITTLQRAYKVLPPSPGIDWETLRVVVQTELRRFNFDKMLLERIEYSLRHYDPCRTGMIDREPLRSVLRGAKIPVDKALINFLIDKYPSGDDCCRVNYCEIMKFLNWQDNPVADARPASLACIMKWLEPQPPKEINCVNYRAFLYDVCPNIKCSLPEVCCEQPQSVEICSSDNCDQGENDCNNVPEESLEEWEGFY